MREPLSTITNAAYMVVGIAVLYQSPPLLGVLLGVSCIVLSVGSAAYHWSLTDYGAAADEVGMYVVLLAICAIAGNHFVPSQLGWSAAWAVGAFTMAGLYDRIDSFVAVPVMALLGCIAVGAVAGWYAAGFVLAVFAASALVRSLGDMAKRNGSRRGHDALHALWHPGTAFAIWLGYQFLVA